jgi:hypothetical protein
MAVDRLFSVEFAKQGLANSTPLKGFGVSSFGGSYAGRDYPGAMVNAERERAFIKYSSPLLERLAADPATAQDERSLFKQISDQVKQPDFKEFLLALLELSNRHYIEATGQNEFGDHQFKMTELGRSVAPPTA